jgi:hypothetical protein
MRQLSSSGQQMIADIARRHGFSVDAVLSMLQSVINGNGSMAQFNHPEFSGSGQWMSGGMTMVSDMFNNYLKGRVDGLCSELSRLLANQPDLLRSGSFQSQSQGGQQQDNHSNNSQQQQGGFQSQNGNAHPSASLFIAPAPGTGLDWWPADLRWPNSTGAQNGVRYANFAQARRLVIEVNGKVTVYDTQDHQIGGFSQQQSQGGSLSFTSQHGLIDVSRLPIVSVDGVPFDTQVQGNTQPFAQDVAPAPLPTMNLNSSSNSNLNSSLNSNSNPNLAPAAPPSNPAAQTDIFAMIEKLADLRGRALLSDDEFTQKKTELLARL